MRKTLFLSGAFALMMPSFLPAQAARWNDRPSETWSDEAPRVRVAIEESRAVPFGAPLRVRFEVSDNAFVTVVRVDDDGRMTILFPYSRNQRAAARGGMVHYVRNPRLGGDVSFIANDRFGGGYVFAIASYAPLDFSAFENRDYDRVGGWSRFTVANRSIARRPDVFIDRFAAAVLWDRDTPYDYDVDYYHPLGYGGNFNAYALCGASALGHFYGYRTYLAQLSSWERMLYPYAGMCSDWYYQMQCYTSLAFSNFYGCGTGILIASGPRAPVGGLPGDPGTVPNESVVRGGLFTPTPVPVPVEGSDAPPMERPVGRFDQVRADGSSWDNVLSIPARATKKMKDDDAQRERSAAGSASPARTGFDRADASSKPEKARTASAEGATRAAPPSREPTKAKALGEPRRETASKGGFGSTTGRTSEPRSTGPDRVSRPADSRPSSPPPNPPSMGTTTEKKKPPTD